MRKVWLALLTALGLIVLLCLTLALFGLPVMSSLQVMAAGAFGDKFGLSRTAVKMTPLLLAGLGMVVAWRSGMYNIGGEGQFLMGGLGGAVAAKLFMGTGDVSPWIQTPVLLAASVAGGALWASLAAWLFVKRGVEVVISTILLNFVAVQLLGWAVEGPLQESKGRLPQSELLPEAVQLWRPDRQLDLHTGVLLALLAAVLIYILLFKTVFGFRLRLVGANARVARANRIPVAASQFQALALSGALCGLAGGVEFTGMAGQVGADFAQGWGFLAIPVALLGGLHPLGTVLSALFFGAVFAGSEHLSRFTVSGATLLYVVQGAAVLAFIAVRSGLLARRTEVATST